MMIIELAHTTGLIDLKTTNKYKQWFCILGTVTQVIKSYN